MTRFVLLILLTAGAGWTSPLKPVSSAEVCGRCHRAIVQAWKLSAHADAMESILFGSYPKSVIKDNRFPINEL